MNKTESILKILTLWEQNKKFFGHIAAVESHASIYREALKQIGSKKKASEFFNSVHNPCPYLNEDCPLDSKKVSKR